MSDTGNNRSREKKKRVKLHETTQENDLRFIGPLTAQHFKILGWICIVIAQAAVILRVGGRLNQGFGDLAATSAIGRVITVILGVYGIIVVALITSIIVNFYGEMKKADVAQEPSQASSASDQGRKESPEGKT